MSWKALLNWRALRGWRAWHAVVAGFALLFAAGVARGQSAGDACSLLTQAQVSAATGVQVGAGTYTSPKFKTTCTWSGPGTIVTLMIEETDDFDHGKSPMSPIMSIVPKSGVGDDAYYVVIRTTAALHTKKGGTAFKTTVYSKQPVDKLEAMEQTMATQVAGVL